MRKAKAWYCILNDDLDKHEFITAQDKDYKPNFWKLVRMATSDTFSAAHAVGGVGEVYGSDDTDKFEDYVNDELSEDFLDTVYGDNSKLANAEYLKIVSGKEGSWIFDPAAVREKVLKGCGIDEKHFD